MIKLWEKNTPYFDPSYGQEEPGITPYLIRDGKPHPGVIVFPGGGYAHFGLHEGEPIAMWLNTLGINAFVLRYRLSPYPYQAILADALRAVRLVRYNAEKFGVIPDKIGTIGFSAGGHLASCTAFCYDMAEPDANDPVDAVSSRADCVILSYPVITFGEYTHEGSRTNFLGAEEKNEELRRRFSGEENVTENTPPIFLWHTVEDGVVPVENSLNLALALKKKNIPFALHIYPFGEHGIGLGKDNYQAITWTKECQKWLYETFEMERE